MAVYGPMLMMATQTTPPLRGLEPLPTIIFSKNTLSIYLFYSSEIAGQINFLHVCCQKGDIWGLW